MYSMCHMCSRVFNQFAHILNRTAFGCKINVVKLYRIVSYRTILHRIVSYRIINT